jgi:hypothetical protein
MIAVSFEVSEAVLSHLRAQGEQTSVEMFEPPPPPSLERCPLLQERLARSLHALSEKDAEQLAEWLEGRARADLPMAS